jgi:hypothetical protein
MSINPNIEDSNFREINRSSRADDRGCLILGEVAKKKNYRIMINDAGQILLDPIVAIPEKEIWLWQNQSAKASLEKGLKDSEEGTLYDLGSFACYADLGLDD